MLFFGGFFLIPLFLIGINVIAAIYVYNDAKLHTDEPLLWFFIVLLIPFLIGIVLYLILRDDFTTQKTKCPNCNQEVDKNFTYCPYCHHSIKKTCPNCSRVIQDQFSVCPYCGTSVKKKCNSCGALLELDYKVCPSCGKSVDDFR